MGEKDVGSSGTRLWVVAVGGDQKQQFGEQVGGNRRAGRLLKDLVSDKAQCEAMKGGGRGG